MAVSPSSPSGAGKNVALPPKVVEKRQSGGLRHKKRGSELSVAAMSKLPRVLDLPEPKDQIRTLSKVIIKKVEQLFSEPPVENAQNPIPEGVVGKLKELAPGSFAWLTKRLIKLGGAWGAGQLLGEGLVYVVSLCSWQIGPLNEAENKKDFVQNIAGRLAFDLKHLKRAAKVAVHEEPAQWNVDFSDPVYLGKFLALALKSDDFNLREEIAPEGPALEKVDWKKQTSACRIRILEACSQHQVLAKELGKVDFSEEFFQRLDIALEKYTGSCLAAELGVKSFIPSEFAESKNKYYKALAEKLHATLEKKLFPAIHEILRNPPTVRSKVSVSAASTAVKAGSLPGELFAFSKQKMLWLYKQIWGVETASDAEEEALFKTGAQRVSELIEQQITPEVIQQLLLMLHELVRDPLLLKETTADLLNLCSDSMERSYELYKERGEAPGWDPQAQKRSEQVKKAKAADGKNMGVVGSDPLIGQSIVSLLQIASPSVQIWFPHSSRIDVAEGYTKLAHIYHRVVDRDKNKERDGRGYLTTFLHRQASESLMDFMSPSTDHWILAGLNLVHDGLVEEGKEKIEKTRPSFISKEEWDPLSATQKMAVIWEATPPEKRPTNQWGQLSNKEKRALIWEATPPKKRPASPDKIPIKDLEYLPSKDREFAKELCQRHVEQVDIKFQESMTRLAKNAMRAAFIFEQFLPTAGQIAQDSSRSLWVRIPAGIWGLIRNFPLLRLIFDLLHQATFFLREKIADHLGEQLGKSTGASMGAFLETPAIEMLLMDMMATVLEEVELVEPRKQTKRIDARDVVVKIKQVDRTKREKLPDLQETATDSTDPIPTDPPPLSPGLTKRVSHLFENLWPWSRPQPLETGEAPLSPRPDNGGQAHGAQAPTP